jgi:hypothetical protein
MKVSRFRQGLFFVIAASALGLGCELIVDFDRTKIPVDESDGAIDTSDGSIDASIDTSIATQEASTDAADAADTSVKDAGSEADAPDGD